MPNSFNRIWIHAIWSTKNREGLIDSFVEEQIHSYIEEELTDLGCKVSIINGMPDHIHCLFLLNPTKALADVLKQVKGATAHRVNYDKLIDVGLVWQKGYAAFSVSESMKEKIYHYIRLQKEHHSKQNFANEIKRLLELNKLGNEKDV